VPVFPYFADTANAFRVVEADFVNIDEGTGLVHIAPAFGDDDFKVGKREGVEVLHHVDMAGKFVAAVTDFAGMSAKPKDDTSTDVAIIKYLAARDLLLAKQKVRHSYPHCWRCEQPLLNYATSSFFVKVTAIKDELVANNQKINWLPEHFKNGRFGKWLEGARDWAISRNRFWGTPLPLWQSDDGDFICVGSRAELERWSGQKITDLHKHVVDKIVIEHEGKTYRRIPDVLDCWFESGSMPYASGSFPADFISEGQDQTRGWFYTLHVLATALKNKVAFRNVIVNGVILASDGKKMSKRLKNYPDPQEIFDQYGADALRLYLMTSPVLKAENLNFEEKDVARLRRQVMVIAWNCVAFARQAAVSETGERKPEHVLDEYWQWLTQELVRKMTEAFDQYRVIEAGKQMIEYVDELSTFYLRLSRERLKNSAKSLSIFWESLQTLAVVMAPIMPFLSELVYQNLTGKLESVHLESWPKVEAKKENKQLVKTAEAVKAILATGQAKRKQLGIRVRQPLSKLTIITGNNWGELVGKNQEWVEIIKNELNVKAVAWQAGEGELQAEYDTELTSELEAEGRARELIRVINGERKKRQLAADAEWVWEVSEIPTAWQEEIERRTNTKLKLMNG
jgi:isoleucyl-tRNA synthetase